MYTGLHIYATTGGSNCGDFFIGNSTKYAVQKLLKEKIKWSNLDVRGNFNEKTIDYFNTFDYIVIGAGGLILPDTNPNNVSAWQFKFPTNLYKKIKSKVIVYGLGYNLFPKQEYKNNKNIFKNNIEELIKISHIFYMRHRGDCEQLKKIVDPELHSKILFKFCPVTTYIRDNYLPTFTSHKIYHAFEVKDDRPHYRFYNSSRNELYNSILEYINLLIKRKEKIAIMKHDNSNSFINFLNNRNITYKILDNTIQNEQKIINNFSIVKKLYCMSGHGQMIADSLGVNYYSIITHSKLKFFLQDKDKYTKNNFYDPNVENNKKFHYEL